MQHDLVALDIDHVIVIRTCGNDFREFQSNSKRSRFVRKRKKKTRHCYNSHANTTDTIL